ncbi:unnamed protein product [Mytilus coruscus]|uniref:Ig-like domain-containing protein n=1 Tax=Mytilus coruscus TaxID=42192 RepID=A0A6J8EJ40_MYTCO|nr:unnamed protein product [Mytilus coruscus]
MSPVFILMAITFHLQIVSGIGNGNGIVAVRVQRGERVILKCLSSGVMRSWLGPDFSNLTNEQALIYFSNYLKNPKLSMSKYSVQAKNGNYDLTIFNFQKVDTGFYSCRCFNDHDNGTFNETKYNVSLLDEGVETSTIGYERRRDLGHVPGIQVNVKETSSQCKKGMNSFVVSFKRVAERNILAEDTREQPDLIDEPAEQSDGLNYVDVLMEPLASRQTRIRGIENEIMYTEIDHSLKA